MNTPNEDVLKYVLKASESMRVDINIIKAIIQVESGWNTYAARYEPHTDKYVLNSKEHASRLGITSDTETQFQKMSIGLFQTMGFLCRELGFRGHLTMLTSPEISIFYGTKQLKRLFDRYGNEDHVISAYNQGGPYKLNGEYKNADYVGKVKLELDKLRGHNIIN